LLPQIVDAVSIPVIATGGIADARQVAAALTLGASAVMIGTALLRSPEAGIHAAWAERIGQTEAHQTTLTRAFTGRAGRAIVNRYVEAAAAPGAPKNAPYPVQRGFTRPMRDEAARASDAERMQMWAGQSARLARTDSATTITKELWDETAKLLS
jgi:nitronate monooxygenase